MHTKHAGFAVTGILLLAGCVYVPLGTVPKLISGQLATAGKATLQLTPQVSDGSYVASTTTPTASGYQTQAVVPVYTRSDIRHLFVQVFKVASGSEVPLMDAAGNPVFKDVTGSDLGKTITFTGLHPNIPYRFRAYAYSATSTASAHLISIDASSSTEVTLPGEASHDATLPVRLKDARFDGQASSSLDIQEGAYDQGQEGLSAVAPRAYQLTTLAGSTTSGSADGTGAAARFLSPYGVAVDGSGTVYVADTLNHMIRKITPGGVVTTLAGSTTPGQADGTGTAASFYMPQGIAVDAGGNVYVGDTSNHKIRKITPGGVVTTLAGATTSGHADGTGSAASFNDPRGVAVDMGGNVYVADYSNHEIRKICPAGVVTTLAGATTHGHADGTGAAASFRLPSGVAVAQDGSVYVADFGNNLIRKITPAGVVTTLAGSTTSGHADGTGTIARFFNPHGVAVDGSGILYVADANNNGIRKVSPAGVVTTLAGSPTTQGHADGPATTATFNVPKGLAVDSSGNVYVADTSNSMIRKIQ